MNIPRPLAVLPYLTLAIAFAFGNAIADPGATDAMQQLDLPGQHMPAPQRLTAGALTEDDLRRIADAGVAHVINIQHPDELDYDAAAVAESFGLQHHHYPIAGADALTPEAVAWLDTTLDNIADEPVVLHCASSNRVGAMMALHAAWYRGMDADDAITFGQAHGLAKLEPRVREILAAAQP